MLTQRKSKFLIMMLPVIGAAFVLSYYKVFTWDVFWHLKTGQVILQSKSLIKTNLFSGAYPDHPWPNPEWLFQIFLAWVHSLWGWAGVSVSKVALVVLTGIVIYSAANIRTGKPLLAASMTVIALCGIQFRMTERPHLFSFLLFSMTVFIVERYRSRGGRLVWLLPPLFVLWSNIHPELLMALIYLAAVCGGEFFNSRKGQADGKRWKKLAVATLLCLPATLFNPEVHHVLLFPFLHLFLGPTLTVTEYGYSSPLDVPLFWVFLLGSLCVLVLSRSGWDWGDIIPFGGMAILGILYLRAIPYFFLAALPVVSGMLSGHAKSKGFFSRGRMDLIIIVLACSALTWALGFDKLVPYQWGLGINESALPVAAVDFLEKEPFPPVFYNHYGSGGYLIYRLYPKMGVFQDGRVQAYPREFIARLHSRFSPEDWLSLLEEYGVNTALARTIEYGTLFPKEDWAIVFWDDRWCVLIRKNPANSEINGKFEYRFFKPGQDIMDLEDPEQVALLVQEMRRNQSERVDPSPVIENDLGLILIRAGEPQKAEKAYLRALSLSPDYAYAWINLGSLYLERGRRAEAVDAFQKALDIDPGLERARRLLDKAGTSNPDKKR